MAGAIITYEVVLLQFNGVKWSEIQITSTSHYCWSIHNCTFDNIVVTMNAINALAYSRQFSCYLYIEKYIIPFFKQRGSKYLSVYYVHINFHLGKFQI